MGHLIPAGTGFPVHRDVQVSGGRGFDEEVPAETEVAEA